MTRVLRAGRDLVEIYAINRAEMRRAIDHAPAELDSAAGFEARVVGEAPPAGTGLCA
jgi:hypothetical protein